MRLRDRRRLLQENGPGLGFYPWEKLKRLRAMEAAATSAEASGESQ